MNKNIETIIDIEFRNFGCTSELCSWVPHIIRSVTHLGYDYDISGFALVGLFSAEVSRAT